MGFPGSLFNRTFQLDFDYFPWITDNVNRTLLVRYFCLSLAETVIIGILFIIQFLVISLAVYRLCCLFRSHQPVPIFVINLFVSDIMQICFRPLLHICSVSVRTELFWVIYDISILANIGFMLCISLERYVMIKYPVWYRFHNSFKYSFPLCLVVWTIPIIEVWIVWFLVTKQHFEYAFRLSVIQFLIPYPLFVFCFVGSWRALSHSVSVTPDEQKRILRILALVLFNYTVMFLPCTVHAIIFSVSFEYGQRKEFVYLQGMSIILMYLNPLADCFLYVFIRKDASSILRGLCCKKLSENPQSPAETSYSLTRREITVQTYRETAE